MIAALRQCWSRLRGWIAARWAHRAVAAHLHPVWIPGSQAFCATSTRWWDGVNAVHTTGPRLGDVLVIDRVIKAQGDRVFLAFTRFPGVAFSAAFFRPVGNRPGQTITVETTDAS